MCIVSYDFISIIYRAHQDHFLFLLRLAICLFHGWSGTQTPMPCQKVGKFLLNLVLLPQRILEEWGMEGNPVPRDETEICVGAAVMLEETLVDNQAHSHHLSPTRYSRSFRIVSKTSKTRIVCSIYRCFAMGMSSGQRWNHTACPK